VARTKRKSRRLAKVHDRRSRDLPLNAEVASVKCVRRCPLPLVKDPLFQWLLSYLSACVRACSGPYLGGEQGVDSAVHW
jgi:hypothetical protein